MAKHIVAVGCEIPGRAIRHIPFKSNESLLDADIAVFSLDFSSYSVCKTFAGQPLLSEDDSGELRAHAERWRTELATALEHGKTVFLFMRGIEDFSIYSGGMHTTGTGRSYRVVNEVVPFKPYSVVPVGELEGAIRLSQGERIKPTKDLGPLSSYWQEFEPYSYYDVYLDKPIGRAALVTQTGDKMVGGVARWKDWKGALVFLPIINFDLLVKQRQKQMASRKRQGKAKKPQTGRANASVGAQFAKVLTEIDKVLRLSSDRTPLPSWAAGDKFVLREERQLRSEITSLEARVDELQIARAELQTRLDTAGNLRGLLYETGHPLEGAVLEALRLLGFAAENYKDADSEFDAVFVAPEGDRLIGEGEGKNDKAINIDKLDQLERNVREDFEKRTDSTYAKGVLFGNASRLMPLEQRGDFFTPKCIAGAKRSGIALVRTPDLFPIAKYLKEHSDAAFAKNCRAAILGTSGAVVAFPPTPQSRGSFNTPPDGKASPS